MYTGATANTLRAITALSARFSSSVIYTQR